MVPPSIGGGRVCPQCRVRPRAGAYDDAVRGLYELWADRRVRYLFVGGLSVLANYVIFSGVWLASGAHWPYLVVAVIANLATAAVMFPAYRRSVFRADGARRGAFLRFCVVWFTGLGLGLVGLPLLVEGARLPVLV